VATAYVGSEWNPPGRDGDKEPGRAVLAAGSGAGAVEGAAGRGGAAVIGRVPCAAALAAELVRRGVHTMVYDVNACSPGEWDALERAAARARVRLRCGSHLARFAPVMAGVRAYTEGHVSVTATVNEMTHGTGRTGSHRLGGGACGLDVCALAADVAMATFGEAPQVAFAVAPEGARPGKGGDPSDRADAGVPGGHARGVADHTAAMLRFSGGRAALLSLDSLPQAGCVIDVLPPDIAYAGVEITGHGGHLAEASLSRGTIEASWAAGMCMGGLSIGGPGGEDEWGDAWDTGSRLGRYLPAMVAELETGAAPAWPPPEWVKQGVIDADGTSGTDGVPLDPPWLPARSARGRGLPTCLPPPSSLAHVMEAILVSINTGAPVYLDQR